MEPGYTHLELAALEQHHEVMVVTQNVDGLHSKAGSGRVVELHGNIDRLVEREGHLVPDIVLFGDPIDPFELARVLDFTSKPVDALIVVGTTLQFEYLWSIVYKCRMYGAKLYLIDADEDHEYKDQFHYYYKPVESLITRLFINYQE
jgi:NAD-dependent deacetylase